MLYLSNYLRQWRKQGGYTQQQMAEFLAVHRTTYTKYELGVVEPSLEMVCRMADLMGCSTDALLGRE